MTPADSSALVDALLSASRVMVAIAAKNLAGLDIDLTLPQYRALVVLAGDGPQRGVDLARTLHLAPSTVTRTCDRLVRRQLVARFQDGDDRRTVWLHLTTAGQELVGTVMRARRREIEHLVNEAGLAASTDAVRLLRTFVETAGEIPDPQWWKRWELSTQSTIHRPTG